MSGAYLKIAVTFSYEYVIQWQETQVRASFDMVRVQINCGSKLSW